MFCRPKSYKNIILNTLQLHFFHLNEGGLNSKSVEMLVTTDVYSVHFYVSFWEPANFSAQFVKHLYESKFKNFYGDYLVGDKFLKK